MFSLVLTHVDIDACW